MESNLLEFWKACPRASSFLQYLGRTFFKGPWRLAKTVAKTHVQCWRGVTQIVTEPTTLDLNCWDSKL